MKIKLYMEEFKPDFALRTSLADYKQTNNFTDLPLYCIEKVKVIMK